MSRPPSPLLVAETDSIRNDPQPDIEMLPQESPHDPPGPSTFFPPAVDDPMSATAQRARTPEPEPPLPELDSDDEVVSTLPVYLSSTFPLSMFQYPLNHRSLSVPQWAADRGKKITTRVKEQAGRVEIEIPVDAGGNVWREERARELGFVPEGREGRGEKEDKRKEEKWGDKLRLRGEGVPVGESMFAGIVHEGALNLHPLGSVLQFRTAMQYLDDFDSKNRGRGEDEERKKAAARKDMPKGLDDPNNDGSGSIKDFRNKMWSTAQREDEDKWVPYEWHEGMEDGLVIDSLEGMLVPDDKRAMLECQTRGLDYLDRDR